MASSYEVQAGDTLSEIARAHGTTWQALQKLNQLDNADAIWPGQILKVAISSGPAASVEAKAGNAPPSTPARPPTHGDDWPTLIAKFGDAAAQADFDAGRRVMLALRKPTNFKANAGRGVYDDRFVIVQRAGDGLQVAEFKGTTEPSGQYARDGIKKHKRMGNDINKDGKIEIGRLLAGNYRYQKEAGEMGNGIGGAFFRATKVQAAQRDVDNNGEINAADMIDPSGAKRSMLIHRGSDNNTFSAGCQTIPKSRYPAFVKALGGQNEFSYILIDL